MDLEHVSHIGEMKNEYRILVGKPERKRPLRRQGMDGRIILNWILEKYSGKLRT
jgi:hypothetical protein